MTLSYNSSRFTNFWTILIDPGIIPLFITRVGNRKFSAISSLYQVFDKGKSHLYYTRIL